MTDNTHTTEETNMLDRPPLTRRLGVGLTLLIVGSFGFGVWACGTATNHHAQTYTDKAVKWAGHASEDPVHRLGYDVREQCNGALLADNGLEWACSVATIDRDPGDGSLLVAKMDKELPNGWTPDRVSAELLRVAPAGIDRVTVYGPQGQTLATAGQEATS